VNGRVLVIAGSDSGGGAGIQADIKAIMAMGGYAATAVTALTAQNTLGVHGVHPVPVAFLRQQIRVVLEDIGADAVKTGMLGDVEAVEAVADELERSARGVPLVVDPVMVAKGGAPLLAGRAIDAVRRRLVPLATLITPNVPEAEALLGRRVTETREAAAALRGAGAAAALVKGGHLEGARVIDALADANGVQTFEMARIDTPHTHGTGCTLASAIAAGLAQGMHLRDAVARARAYVQEAIRTAPGFGHGHGPLNHSALCPARIPS
jgi:hydroxymethylpyrimidine/phosphomethylpyrimidine kinase